MSWISAIVLPIFRTLHFDGWKSTSHSRGHKSMLSISYCSISASETSSIVLDSFVSSTNIYNIDSPVTLSGRSLIYTTINSEYSPFTPALGFLSIRKVFSQFRRTPPMPYDFNFRISLLCDTLSKAFIKSKYIASIDPPLSRIFVHSSRTLSSWCVVDRPPVKQNCLLENSQGPLAFVFIAAIVAIQFGVLGKVHYADLTPHVNTCMWNLVLVHVEVIHAADM